MKKNLLNWMTILMVAIVSVAFISCGNKNDELSDSPGNILTQELTQYAWQSNSEYNFMEWGDNSSLSKDVVTVFFFSDNSGIWKYESTEWDTYFGKSKSAKPYAFSYIQKGQSVSIDDKSFQYIDGSLVASDGTIFVKRTINNSDKTWLESAKYYVMEDEARCSFNFEHACIPFSQGGDLGNGTYYYDFNLYLGVSKTEHLKSRQIAALEATYSISGGSFRSSKPKHFLQYMKM